VPDRANAIERGRVALDELVVDGLITNVDFHRALIGNPTFLDGGFTTNLLDRFGSGAFLAAAR
jgi:acetyl-CoA carboxylase biotin carboxylase subunit